MYTKKVGQLMSTFALLAILVTCLGLFGLAAFTAEQRTKEIGVRKVLGASVKSIVLLLSTEFAKLVIIANLIAWPVAYFLADDWLQNFAYRVDLSWWVFASGGVIVLLIALGTVSYQALRAAVANPIDALRYV
jgi:putative ABC transport system permease protein